IAGAGNVVAEDFLAVAVLEFQAGCAMPELADAFAAQLLDGRCIQPGQRCGDVAQVDHQVLVKLGPWQGLVAGGSAIGQVVVQAQACLRGGFPAYQRMYPLPGADALEQEVAAEEAGAAGEEDGRMYGRNELVDLTAA